jgi:ribosomal protein S24E
VYALQNFFEEKRQRIVELIRNTLVENKNIKVNFHFECEQTNSVGEILDKNFKTQNIPIFEETDIIIFLNKTFEKLVRDEGAIL